MDDAGRGWSLAVIGGLFLPWATLSAPLVGTISVYGSQGDGIFAAGAGALAIVAGVLTLSGKGRAAPKILAVTATAVVTLIVVFDYPSVTEMVSDTAMGRVGVGMYAVVVSAVVLAVGMAFVFRIDTGTAKALKGVDGDVLSARTQELMESDGIKWKKAYALAVAELPERTSTPTV